MAKISIKFTPPLSDVEANWRRLASAGIYESIARLGNEADEVMLSSLQAETPVDTGKLRDDTHSVQRPLGRGVSYAYRTAPYADFVIFGTKPHEIVPVSAKFLAFLGADGNMVFTNHVNHPGTAATDYPMRAWNAARGEVLEILSRTGREILDQVT